MKKFFVVGLVAIIGIFAVIAVPNASAAPAEATGKGPYDGVLHGTIYAPNGSEAAMSLDLTHQGNDVSGTVFIGEGLTVDAGVCGAAAIPASSIYAEGNTSTKNPRYLSADTSFDVNGIAVTVDLESTISAGTINAEAKIDLPWICGGDPILTGTLHSAS